MNKAEERIQIALSDYLRMQYPKVIFTFDASGLKLPMGLAVKAKKMRSGRGMPDMMIFAPKFLSHLALPFYGLFIEIKVDKSDVYLKDGETIKADDHVKEQAAIIKRLNKEGYCAGFGFGFDDCKETIDWYLGGGK